MKQAVRAPFLPLLLALAALVASACSYSFTIIATLANGRLVFESDDDADHPPWCLSLRVRGEDGITVWQFDRPYPEPTDAKCGPNFPLAYGELPAGARLKTGPEPIVPGRLYSVQGNGGGSLSGYFRVSADGRSVQNLKRGEVDVDALDSDLRINSPLEPVSNVANSSGS